MLCLLIGFPFAYWLAVKVSAKWRGLLLGLVIVPFWTSFLIRTVAWRIVLAPEGFISHWLQTSACATRRSASSTPARRCSSGVVYNYLPLMIFPLFVALDRLDRRAAGGEQGPRRQPGADVHPGHAAARHAGHHRRAAAGVHPAGR